MAKTTREIAGHELTLEEGVRYLATRPLDGAPGPFDVSIHLHDTREVVLTVPGLLREQADALLRAFNNGRTSFEGRVW